MFYSHEVLTSRKYGVATVWLVATLGSKSGLKKVSRKAILDVDVTKTCDTIITPEAPMALRLQSNLLYGVTQIYAQQCGYVLTDAENAKNNMRAMLKVMRTSQLDAEGGNKARADQLVLQDDPNFLPEIDLLSLNFDAQLAALGDSQLSGRSQSPGSSQLTTAPFEDIGGILIPHSASSFAGGPVGGGRAFSVLGDSGAGSRIGSAAFHEPEGLLEDDLGMVIDEEGNVTMVEDMPARQETTPMGRGDRSTVLSEGGSAGLRTQQRPPAQGAGQLWQPDDDGYVPMQDDNDVVMIDNDDHVQQQPADGSVHHSTTSETAEAPVRRQRAAKIRILSLDNATELHGQDLNRWQHEYLQNMLESRQHKQGLRLNTVAKQNAEHWVLGGSLGNLPGGSGPLSMFSGLLLLEAMTGRKLTPGGEKRPLEEDSSSEGIRRVRSRGEPSSDELGRGGQDDGFIPVVDDYEIEQGREQPTPLDDRNMSSVFPWNQSAGSQRPTGLFGVNATSSIGGMPLGPLSRRGSRLTTASPLLGHGEVAGDEDVLLPGSNPDIGLTGLDDFELFGPAADVDTQTAAQSQWVRTALDGESANFLTFVQAGIDELDEQREQVVGGGGNDDDATMGAVDFDHLLPPANNTYIVAAQALLHVLTLGTKNAITVQQEEAYGPISLRMVEAI